MMGIKKILALITSLALLATFATGCNSKKEDKDIISSSVSDDADDDADVDDDADADDDADVDDDTAEYAEALAGTLWLGMDSEYNCFALGFNDQEIVLEANDGSSISGYWGVAAGDPTIYIFEDSELTTEISSIPWTYDFENNLMILNDTAIMAQTEDYSFDEAAAALEQMALASQVQEFLQGTYWVAIEDDEATAIHMNDNEFELIVLGADGSENSIAALWSMDYDLINLYDESYQLINSFGWDMAEDGSVLSLTNDSEEPLEFAQVSEEDATDIMAYLYLSIGLEYSGE